MYPYIHISMFTGRNSCQSWRVLGPTRDGAYSLYPAIHETNETPPYYIHTYIDTYIHTYVHTYIRTYTHTHTHT